MKVYAKPAFALKGVVSLYEKLPSGEVAFPLYEEFW